MMIKGIFFDLGLTLIYSPREDIFMDLLKKEGITRSREEVTEALVLTTKYFMREHPGVLSKDPSTFYHWYLEELLLRLEINLEINPFMEKLFREYPPRREWKPYEETFFVLEELTRQGFQLGLISNWDMTARETLEDLSLIDFFDPIIISAEVGIEKPEAGIFLLALEKSYLRGEEVLYVGDNYDDDIVGSTRVGMKGLLINRYPQYYHEERECLIIYNLKDLLDLDLLQ